MTAPATTRELLMALFHVTPRSTVDVDDDNHDALIQRAEDGCSTPRERQDDTDLMGLTSKHASFLEFVDRVPKGSKVGLDKKGEKKGDKNDKSGGKKEGQRGGQKSVASLAKSMRSKQHVSHHVDKDMSLSPDQFDYCELVRSLHWDCTPYFCSYRTPEDDMDWYSSPYDTIELPSCNNAAEAWELMQMPKARFLELYETFFEPFPRLSYRETYNVVSHCVQEWVNGKALKKRFVESFFGPDYITRRQPWVFTKLSRDSVDRLFKIQAFHDKLKLARETVAINRIKEECSKRGQFALHFKNVDALRDHIMDPANLLARYIEPHVASKLNEQMVVWFEDWLYG